MMGGQRRMSNKRMSLAPSVIMAPGGMDTEVPDRGSNAKEFICSHVKTIVTVIMIFGTISVIVLIVMVHKWKYEQQQLDADAACYDVAIIGAGISGTYAAWRLRHSGRKIGIFEQWDRIGGRIHTHRLPGMPELHAELGAMYYMPQSHRRINSTIHALHLNPSSFPRPSRARAMYYLRGHHLPAQDLNTNRVPYTLEDDERRMYPEELQNLYLRRATSNASMIYKDPLKATSKDGVFLYKQGFWNLLSSVGSHEGYHFLYDTSPWRSLLSNENAAMLGSVEPDGIERLMTIDEGMDAIPKHLAYRFLNASIKHDLYLNQRLNCIQKNNVLKAYKLTMTQTKCKDGEIISTQEAHDVCAKSIILAIPKDAVENMDWKPMREEHHIKKHMRGLEAVSAIRIFFTYDKPWWEKTQSPVYRIVTDLPIRQVQYIGGHIVKSPHNDVMTQEHVLMVANLDARDTEYFAEMIEKYRTRHKRHRNCTQSRALIRDITSQLSRAFEIDQSEIPEPTSVIIQEWTEDKGGSGWHVWKRGVKWTSSPVVSLKPLKFERIYLAGSTYCGGQCALWMEGALRTVDRVLGYFATPS